MNIALPFNRLAAKPDASDRLLLALLLSALLHLLLLFGVHFKVPSSKFSGNNAAPLEVVLVNSKSAAAPKDEFQLAQANLDGGGNSELEHRARNPLPPLDSTQSPPLPPQTPRPAAEAELQTQKLMTQPKAAVQLESGRRQQDKKAESANAASLVQRSLAAARLEAQIARTWDDYQKGPRRKFVSARTQEYRFAQYIEDWRIKAERVGNLNYPEAAKQQKLYGSLQVTVSIRRDGSLEAVEINRPSGHKILDAAAAHIVQLAAPFAPLPEEIRKDTDVLSIVSTWTFTRSDQLQSE